MEKEDVSELISMYFPGSFTQWSADNVGHNVRTLGGKGTIHAMGIVCSTTSMHRSVSYSKMNPIQRQIIKKVVNLIKNKGIAVTTYIPPEKFGLSKLMFKASAELVPSFCEPKNFVLYFLWHTAIFLKNTVRPGWSGYMANVCVEKYPGKSSVNLLPIIDLDPSNMSGIYSTVKFVIGQAKRL